MNTRNPEWHRASDGAFSATTTVSKTVAAWPNGFSPLVLESIRFASTNPRSNNSILCPAFLMFSTISGNLLLARSKPRHHNWIGVWHSFGTVLAHLFGRSTWFDQAAISEPDRLKIARNNAQKLFHL